MAATPAGAGATDGLGKGSQHSSVSVGDIVQMWDHPHVLVTTFGRTYRAKVRGKVAAVENGHIRVWTQEYRPSADAKVVVQPGTWSGLRVLPAEYVVRSAAPSSEARRDRERARLARKRRIYREQGIPL